MVILMKIMSHCLETKLNAFMQTYAISDSSWDLFIK